MLPEDNELAKNDLLSHFDEINKISEVYVLAYGITLEPLVEKFELLDSHSVSVNILSDYVQTRGKNAWVLAKRMLNNLKHGSIVLTTAGAHSDNPGAIFHHKTISIIYNDGREPLNFFASANFSGGSWNQGNICKIFSSQIFSDNIIKYYQIHKQWALENRSDKQIDSLIESLSIDDIDESNIDLYDEIGKLNIKISNLKDNLIFFKIVLIIMSILLLLKIYQ